MQFDFKGKRVVVCGGSRGIGRAIAEAFARDGAAVAICARGKEGLDKAAGEICRKAERRSSRRLRPGRRRGRQGLCQGCRRGARRHRRPRQQCLWLRPQGRRGGLGAGPQYRPDGDGARVACGHSLHARRRAAARSSTFPRSRASAPRSRSAPYAAVKAAVNNYTASQALTLAPKQDPGQRHRARLDRIPGRHLGAEKDGRPRSLQWDVEIDTLGPHGRA